MYCSKLYKKGVFLDLYYEDCQTTSIDESVRKLYENLGDKMKIYELIPDMEGNVKEQHFLTMHRED